MAATQFCGLLRTLRDAAVLLEPEKDLPTLRAFAALAMDFQPIAVDTPIVGGSASGTQPSSQVSSRLVQPLVCTAE